MMGVAASMLSTDSIRALVDAVKFTASLEFSVEFGREVPT